METVIDESQWQAVRTSVERTAQRFADLAAAIPEQGTMVTPRWSMADVVAHVVGVAWLDATLLRPDQVAMPVPDLLERLSASNVDGINDLNEVMLATLPLRDPKALAAILCQHVETMLAASRTRDPNEPMAWVGDSRVPLAGLFAHLQNEMLLHGYDLGRLGGQTWLMTSQDAAPFFDMFIMGLARHGAGHLLDGGDRPREKPIAVEFRSDYTTPGTLVLENGRVRAEPPGDAPDVRLTFDPLTMTMMMFGRVSKGRAVLSRKVKVGGRHPWLLPIFLKTFRVPA